MGESQRNLKSRRKLIVGVLYKKKERDLFDVEA